VLEDWLLLTQLEEEGVDSVGVMKLKVEESKVVLISALGWQIANFEILAFEL
jgi:hypothetical protein